MARTTVPYVVARRNRDGTCRYYWRPSADLTRLGFTVARLCADQTFLSDAMIPGPVVEASRPFTAHARAVLAGEMPAPAKDTHGTGKRAQRASIVPGSLAAMFSAYRRDEAYTRKSATTRRSYDFNMARLEAWAGDRIPMAITTPDCLHFYRALRDGRGKRTASLTMSVLRLTMRWGRRKGFPNNDPAASLDMEGTGGDGRLWSDAAITAAVAFFDSEMRFSLGTAITLNGWLGQREGDLIGLRRSQYRNGTIVLTPNKTRGTTAKKVYLPVGDVPHLARRLGDELDRLDQRDGADTLERLDGTIIVNEETGRPYTGNNFRNHMARMRRVLGAAALLEWRTRQDISPQRAVELLRGNTAQTWTGDDWQMWETPRRPKDWPEDRPFEIMPAAAIDRLFEIDEAAQQDPRLELIALQFMHLRHTAVTRMSEGGATAQMIASVTGHSIKWIEHILSIYGVRTRKLAEQAFTLRLAAEGDL